MMLAFYRLVCGMAAGAGVFLTVSAGLFFSAYEPAEAGKIMARLFPAYYAAGYCAFGVAFLLLLLIRRNLLRVPLSLAALGDALIALLLMQLLVDPRIRAAKAAGDEGAFDTWHLISMLLHLWVIFSFFLAGMFPKRKITAGTDGKEV